MPGSLRSQLADLAESFTNAVVDAIRGASLDELLAESGAKPRRGAASRAEAPAAHGRSAATAAAKPTRTSSSGRLRRRSAEDIAGILDSVVGLVKKHGEGLRAEQIRSELGMQAKELPRVLKEGLSSRKLKSKGQKRATTYFAR
jgi:ribosomal protein L12E/L44/L45/RPP1/RPP2